MAQFISQKVLASIIAFDITLKANAYIGLDILYMYQVCQLQVKICMCYYYVV